MSLRGVGHLVIELLPYDVLRTTARLLRLVSKSTQTAG